MMNVYVTGYGKDGEEVNARAFNFPKKAEAMEMIRTMKVQGMFRGWQVITAIYNLDNFKLIKDFAQ